MVLVTIVFPKKSKKHPWTSQPLASPGLWFLFFSHEELWFTGSNQRPYPIVHVAEEVSDPKPTYEGCEDYEESWFCLIP